MDSLAPEGVRLRGILLVPRAAGEGATPARMPALICIHGMKGTPEGVCGLSESPDYHNRFGRRAAERGYVVFAPALVNSQKGRSWLDRKAILVGERLQALEQRAVMRAVDYLAGREDVRKERIGARPVFIEQGLLDRVAWWEMSRKAFEPVKDLRGAGDRRAGRVLGLRGRPRGPHGGGVRVPGPVAEGVRS